MYESCNYALCPVLKATNVISKTDLRRIVASRIAYKIIWNTTRDESYLDIFNVPVRHTATVAACNFMWTDEDNVIAFFELRADEHPSYTSHLIKSLNFYCDRRDHIVVEASLAARTTLMYYLHQITGFVQHRGIDVLILVLEKYKEDSKEIWNECRMVVWLLLSQNLTLTVSEFLIIVKQSNNQTFIMYFTYVIIKILMLVVKSAHNFTIHKYWMYLSIRFYAKIIVLTLMFQPTTTKNPILQHPDKLKLFLIRGPSMSDDDCS